MRIASLALIAALSGGLLAACGPEEEVGPPSSATPEGKLRPADTPKARESIAEAQTRVAQIASSNDCEQINALRPLSRQADPIDPGQCEGFRELAEIDPVAARAYGGGAVIDYRAEDGRRLSAIFVLDADGLYHLALLDETQPSVGTRIARRFDAAAQEAVRALREKDCSRFRDLASARLGPGASPDLCAYVSQEPLGDLLGSHPRARPIRLGGNAGWGFYSVAAPEAVYTIVLSREAEATVSDQAGPAPTSPRYGYVSAYRVGMGSLDLGKPRESLGAATRRISDAASSGDCEDVYTLNPISQRPGADVPRQCETLRRLADFEPLGAAAYRGGAVIDYRAEGAQVPRAVLIRDADGLYHVAMIDGYRDQPSVGTRFPRRFDAAAQAAVEALRERDCEALREVASARYGPGAGGDLCAYVQYHQLANLLASHPEARPRRLGGNGSYGFYGVGTPDAHFTLVMVREAGPKAPPGTPPLPAGASRHAYVDAYLTSAGVSVGGPS